MRGLCHEPTGSILAAATTSLPEEVGGVRNWDYRYCWIRDAAMTARVLVDLGSIAEAEAFLRWVGGCVERAGGHPERLHPLYTVEGYEFGAEAVIETLPGYAGSRPVRVGNLANHQLQLDVFGPVADLLLAVANARGSIRPEELQLLESMVQAVERRWHEPDHGLWEARLARRHHVFSKVMCWMTVDRALQIAAQYGDGPRAEWVALRDRIGANVLEHGWHEEAGAYTVAYGDEDMDASSLWIGLSGLLADDDPRFLSTVLKIEADLRTGRRADAEELFTQMVDTARPHRAAAGAVRPDGRARAGQPPTGVQPSRTDPLRPAARRSRRTADRAVSRRRT